MDSFQMYSWKRKGNRAERKSRPVKGVLAENSTEMGELLSSKEQRHYARAMREMNELVKLESLRIHLSRSDIETETDNGDESQDYNLAYENGEALSCSHSDGETTADEYNKRQKHRSNGSLTKEKAVPSIKRQQGIYHELCQISKGLQTENHRLKKWEARLQEEEAKVNIFKKKLKEYEDSLDKVIDHECEKRCKDFEMAFEQRMLDIMEDSKRTKLSFKVMKQANDTLKKQNSQIEEQNRKLEEKTSSLNNRISNLQRKNEILRKELNEKRMLEESKETSKERQQTDIIERKMKQVKSEVTCLSEAIGTCLDWIAESQLKQQTLILLKNDTNNDLENDVCIEISSEKAFKVIQQLPSILHCISNTSSQIPYLRFIYWSLLLSDFTQKRKGGLPLTAFRRIGEELFRSQILRLSAGGKSDSSNKTVKKCLLQEHSDKELHRRMLAELIVLRTVSQADVLGKVLEALKVDTRKEEGKDTFISYHGSAALLPFLTGQHKGLIPMVVDVLMQLTVESPYLSKFLDNLSTHSWVGAFYDLFQCKSFDNSVMEKLSIVVQRLSKIKSNHKFFEALQFSKLIKDIATNADVERPFFTLNLRSILLNLNSKGTDNIKISN